MLRNVLSHQRMLRPDQQSPWSLVPISSLKLFHGCVSASRGSRRDYHAVRAPDDSLISFGYRAGHTLVFVANDEIRPGVLWLIDTPGGHYVRTIETEGEELILRAGNDRFMPMVLAATDVYILGRLRRECRGCEYDDCKTQE